MILLMNLVVNFVFLNQVKQCASGCFVLEWGKCKAAGMSQVCKKVSSLCLLPIQPSYFVAMNLALSFP